MLWHLTRAGEAGQVGRAGRPRQRDKQVLLQHRHQRLVPLEGCGAQKKNLSKPLSKTLQKKHSSQSAGGCGTVSTVVRKEALDIWHAVSSTAHSAVSLPTRLSPRPETPCCSSDLTLIEPWTDQHRDATAHRRLGRACASCVTCPAGIQRCVHGFQPELVEVSVHALHVAGDERHQVPACRCGSWAT